MPSPMAASMEGRPSLASARGHQQQMQHSQQDLLSVPPRRPPHSASSPSSSRPLSRSVSSATTATLAHSINDKKAASSSDSSAVRQRIPSGNSSITYTQDMSDNSLEISTSLEKDGLTTVVPAADMNSSNENATTSPSSMHRRRARASRANDGHDNEVSPSHHHAAVLVAHAASEVDSIYDHPSLTEEQKKMAIMLRNSRGKRSFVPILYFLAASLGKLILGFGVSLAIKGDYADKTSDFGIGLGLAIGGLLAVIAAALGFGAAVSMINKRWGIIFKCFSIGGGLFISLGYALKQYFVSDEKPMFSIRLSFIPLALGTAMMGISLPNFTAYTELYRGRVVGFPPKHRPLIALLCLSPSMGILFGGWISAEVAHWPIAFNSAVLTFAVALGYAGVALFWSDHLRSKAELYDYLLHKEEEEGIRRKGIALEKEKVAREKGMDILSPDMTRVPTQESAYATPAITPVIMKEGISPV